MTTTGSEPTPRGDGRRGLVGSAGGILRLPLRGRAWETEIVDQAVREVESGASRTLLLRGVAGVGKTRLLGGIADVTRSRGWGVVVAAPELVDHGMTPRPGDAVGERLALRRPVAVLHPVLEVELRR